MMDASELARHAIELKDQGDHEADPHARMTLYRMAECYAHLAQAESWNGSHPVQLHSIMEVLTERLQH